MKRKLIYIFLALVIVISLSACFGGSSVDKGANITETVETDKSYTVGDVVKNGWEIEIPKNTFDGKSDLIMNILSGSESEKYLKGDTSFILPLMELNINGRKNVRLNEPVKVRLLIPKDKLKGLAQEDLFYGYFCDDQWEYFIPDLFDMETGTASFDIYHFSSWSFVKPSEAEQIKTYAKTMAVKKYQCNNAKAELFKTTQTHLNDMFTSMGVNNQIRNQLTADVISYLEDKFIDSSGVAPIDALAQMANSASQGKDGKQAFQNKLLEFTAKGLAASLNKNPDKSSLTPSNVGKLYNVVGNLSSAAGAASGGDSKAALAAIADMLKNYHPVVALTDSALKYLGKKAEDAIDYWTEGEIEKAYQAYIGNATGKYGHLDGEFDTIWTNLGGGQREYEKKILKKYCEKIGAGQTPNDLGERTRDLVLSNAKKALKTYFDNRKKFEPEMAKLQKEEEAFIAALKGEGLLSAFSSQSYFGIDKRGKNYDVQIRLGRLYSLKEKMLGLILPEVPKLSDKAIVSCISQWIYWNEKGDLNGFYEYMYEMGYMKKPENGSKPPSVPVPSIAEPAKPTEATQPEKEQTSNTAKEKVFAWVLMETKSNNWQELLDAQNKSQAGIWSYEASGSEGSATFKRTYLYEHGDGWLKKGMNESGKVTWSAPALKTIKPGEEFSLTLTVDHISSTYKYPSGNWMGLAQVFKLDKDGNQAGGASYLKNKNGESSFTSGGGNNFQSFSETVYGTIGSGSNEGDRMTIRVSASGGVSVQTWYIYEWKGQ